MSGRSGKMPEGFHIAVDVLRDADGRRLKPVRLTEGSAVQGLAGIRNQVCHPLHYAAMDGAILAARLRALGCGEKFGRRVGEGELTNLLAVLKA